MVRLAEIDAHISELFRQRWVVLLDGKTLARPDLIYPGVYLLAFTSDKIAGSTVKPEQILYVGMSNSAGGVRARIKQFIRGIEKNGLHSAAMRFFREQCGGKPYSQLRTRKCFYVAACTIECESNKVNATPDDLRTMGHVACLEYYAIARIVQRTGHKPPLNKYGERITT